MQILHNAHIYTQNIQYPFASALAIQNDRIVAVGSDSDILALFTADDQITDMQGNTILPGLVDSHIHLQRYSLSLKIVDCETDTLQECLTRVAQQSKKTPKTRWVLGHGWNHNNWQGGYGSANLLDQVSPDHPVYLTAKSLHAGWANSFALKNAGITKESIDPQDGVIQRDEKGNPTGILLENAMALVESTIPQTSQQDIKEAIVSAQSHLWRMGLTGVHDFDGTDCFTSLQQILAENRLHLRVAKGIPQEQLSKMVSIGLRSDFGNDWLWIGSIKLFADGALGPKTAAMLSPYEDEEEYSGILFLNGEQIFEIGQHASSAGLSLAIHAIGDRANHEVINALSQLRTFEKVNNISGLRHRIEHVQLLHPDDLSRLAQNQIIASMQPYHAPSDMLMADHYWGSRSRYAYPWNSLSAHGTMLAFGSDAPVENPNPFWGIHAAVNRTRIDGSPCIEGWYPEERISFQQAVEAYTIGASFTAHKEKVLGKLENGFLADLIVLDQDPFKISRQLIYSITPIATMVGGVWVWTNNNEERITWA
jgi:predicted amidohydrolase YtcJ